MLQQHISLITLYQHAVLVHCANINKAEKTIYPVKKSSNIKNSISLLQKQIRKNGIQYYGFTWVYEQKLHS